MTVVALGLVGTACGHGAPREVAAPAVEQAAPEVPATVPATRPPDPVVGDTVPIGAGSVAVLDTDRFGSAGRLFNPPAGREYYAAEVKACSGPAEHGLSFAPGYFLLEMADKTVADPGLPIKRPELVAGEIPAGGCLAGWVTFTIPDQAEPAFVAYDGRLRWRIVPATAKPS
jgi:hypothetical protein